MSKVNDNIRNFRKFRGLSQESVAKQVNRSTNVISNWENGVHSPDIDVCEELCRILKVTPNELFGWDDNPEYIAWIEQTAKLESEIRHMEKEKDDMEKRILEYKKRIAKLRKEN